MKQREDLEVTAQVRFTEDGLEADVEVETDLADWGVVKKEQEQETKYEEPRASSFGVDDREVVKREERKQVGLFQEVDQDQVTLSGEEAEPVPNF